MTTWGGFGIIVCTFIITPIVLLHRSSIPSRWVWVAAIPAVTVGTYLGIFLGPVIFTSMLGCVEWPSGTGHCAMLVAGFLFSIPVAAILFLAKRRNEKCEAQRRRSIRQAMRRIAAGGLEKQPRGPYVPHRKWHVGTAPGTPHATRGRRASGPYGLPMP
jgi:hypothetical protein